MIDWAEKFKPAASARVHVGVAAVMWTVVGAVLVALGLYWTRPAGSMWPALLVVAAAIGVIKARLVLAKAARRILDRIRTRGDGQCLGGFISWKTWLLVIGMMMLGRLLRGGLLPRPVVGFIYEAIGVALLTGAIGLWRGLREVSPQL